MSKIINSVTTQSLDTSNEVKTDILDTYTNTNLQIQRNNTTKLTVGATSITIADDLIVSGGDIQATAINTAAATDFSILRNGSTKAIFGASKITLSDGVIDNGADTDFVIQRNGAAQITVGTAATTLAGDLVVFGSNIDNAADADMTLQRNGSTKLTLGATTATFANDVVVAGNLTVSGTTTTINTEIMTVEDNTIVANAAPSVAGRDGGFLVGRHSTDIVASGSKETGTAQDTGTTSTIILANAASAVDDYYNGWYVRITAGTGSGTTGYLITDYVGTTRTATVSGTFSSAPDSGNTYSLHNQAYAGLVYDESADKFELIGFPLDTTTPNSGVADYVNLKVKSIETTDALSFTTLHLTGDVASSSVDSGTLIVDGGAGIDGALYTNSLNVDTNAFITGTLFVDGSTTLDNILYISPGGLSAAPGSAAALTVTGYAFTDNETAQDGTVAQVIICNVSGATIEAVETGVTTTNAISMYIEAPVAGTNQTVTNPWSIWAEGNARFGALIEVVDGITSASTTDLSLDSSSGNDVLIKNAGTTKLTVASAAAVLSSGVALSSAAGANLELNAVSGQSVQLQVNDAAIATINSAGITVASGKALNAAASNNLELNAPTGQSVQLQINDAAIATVAASGIQLATDVALSAATGDNLELNADTGQAIELQINNTAIATVAAAGIQLVSGKALNGAAASVLELNAVSGQSIELQIADVAEVTIDAGGITLAASNTIDTASGDLVLQSAGSNVLTLASDQSATFASDATINGQLTVDDVVINTSLASNGTTTVKSFYGGITTSSSTSYSVAADDYIVRLTSTSSVAVTLPAANAVAAGRHLYFFKTASGGSITINRAGSDTIDGSYTTTTLANQHDRVEFVSDGSAIWYTM